MEGLRRVAGCGAEVLDPEASPETLSAALHTHGFLLFRHPTHPLAGLSASGLVDGSDTVVSYVLGIHGSAVKLMARNKGHAVSNGRRHNVDVHAERLVGNIGKDMQDSNGRPLHTGSVDPCASLERHTVVGVGFVHVGRLDPELKHVAEAEDSGCKPAIMVRVRDG